MRYLWWPKCVQPDVGEGAFKLGEKINIEFETQLRM